MSDPPDLIGDPFDHDYQNTRVCTCSIPHVPIVHGVKGLVNLSECQARTYEHIAF